MFSGSRFISLTLFDSKVSLVDSWLLNNSKHNSEMSSRSRKSRGADKKKDKYNAQGYLPFQMYPFIPPGYPVNPSQHWPSPSLHPNFQYPWNNPWANQQNYSANSPQWLPGQSVKLSPKHIPDTSPDAYMVNAVRRIYNNDDGSIEIERVKVQRRSGNYDTKLCSLDYPKGLGGHLDSQSLVSVPSNNGELRPPPRKNRNKNAIGKPVPDQDHVQTTVLGGVPQNWYPFLPYTNQIYPFPYPYSYMWPTPSPPTTFDNLSHTDDSDSSHSKHDAPPYSPESNTSFQKLSPHGVTRKDTPVSLRTTSSAAASHVTSSNANDIAPSDSVSMRGFKRKTSLEKMMGSVRTSTNSDFASESLQFSDMDRNKEWAPDSKRVSSIDNQSDSNNVDRFSYTTALSQIPTPPLRSKRQRQTKNRQKSNSESDVGTQDQGRSTTSPPMLSSARVSDTDLVYASKTRRIRSDIVIQPHDTSNQQPSMKSRGQIISSTTEQGKMADELDGRQSVASTLSFHSTRQSADGQEQVDTDSTDIALPTDTATADESTDHLESETPLPNQGEIDYKWVLQDSEDNLLGSLHKDSDERENQMRDSWKAEVSLWRARLVVSLCNGQGLDQGDWNTFNLLVQHPLSVSSKLSLLSAQRICSLNSEFGVVFLRNALLYLTSYGETLLKPEEERTPGWNTIPMDGSQLWSPVKGSVEILYVFGYRLREKGILKYRPKCAPDTSIVARMTLDILVLAEEFRLYLNGMSQNSLNITNLFTPQCSSPELSLGSSNEQNSARVEESSVSKSSQPSEPQEEMPKGAEGKGENVNDKDTKIPKDMSNLEIPSPNLETKISGSNESLTPVASLEHLDKQGLEDNGTTKKGMRDNPEEHIYEEITEVKAQVEALKKCDEPPPLPPKSRPPISKQESTFYPFMDLSLGSQCNSISGSTASRSKKRRAPMPPSFMSDEESQAPDDKLGSASQNEETFATNEVTNVKEGRPLNPFYETRTEASGYVGKNPFYDDVEIKGKTSPIKSDSKSEEISNKTDVLDLQQEKGEEPTSNVSIEAKIQSDHRIATDDEFSEPGVRPQRKKDQNNISGKPNMSPEMSRKEEIRTLNGQLEDKSSGSDSQASVVTVKNSSAIQSKIPDRQQQYLLRNQKTEENKMSKNEARGHQCDSQVVVPSSNSESERENTAVKSPSSDNEKKTSFDKSMNGNENEKSINKSQKENKKEEIVDSTSNKETVEIPVAKSPKNTEVEKLVETSTKEHEGEKLVALTLKDNDGEKSVETSTKDSEREKLVAMTLKDNEGEKSVETSTEVNEGEKLVAMTVETSPKDNVGELVAKIMKDIEGEKSVETSTKDSKREKLVAMTLKDNEEEKSVETSTKVSEGEKLVAMTVETSPKDNVGELVAKIMKDIEGEKSVETSTNNKGGENFMETSPKDNNGGNLLATSPNIEKSIEIPQSQIDNVVGKSIVTSPINNEKDNSVALLPKDDVTEKSVTISSNDNELKNPVSSLLVDIGSEKSVLKLPKGNNENDKLTAKLPTHNEREMTLAKSLKNEGSEKPVSQPPTVAKYPKKPDVIIKEIVISYDISVNGSGKHTAKGNTDSDKHNAKKDHSEETAKIFSLCKKSIFDAIEFIDAEGDSDSPSPQEDEIPYIDLTEDSQGLSKSPNENNSKSDTNLVNLEKQKTQEALTPSTSPLGTGTLPQISVNSSISSSIPIEEPKSSPTPPLGLSSGTPVNRTCKNSYVEGLPTSFTCPSSSNMPVNKGDTTPNINGPLQTPLEINSLPVSPPTPPSGSPPGTPPLNTKKGKLSETLVSNQSDNNPVKTDASFEDSTLIDLPETPHASPPASPVEFLTKIEFSPENSPIILKNKPSDDHAETAPSPLTLIGNNKMEKTGEPAAISQATCSNGTDNRSSDKENIVFDRENVSEKRKPKMETFEERYEIPDVLRAEINSLKMKQHVSMEDEFSESKVATTKDSLGKGPERPPRHRHLHKVPPLPPKPYKHSSPPELPPKGLLKTSAQHRSSGFNPEKVRANGSLERKPHLSHSMSPSPLAIPSVSPQLYTAPAITRQQRRAHASNLPESGSSKMTSSSSQSPSTRSNEESKPGQKFYVPTKSVSMPSSPKASLSRLKRENKSEKDRKSWPFQLCNCLYIKDKKKDNNITIQYVME